MFDSYTSKCDDSAILAPCSTSHFHLGGTCKRTSKFFNPGICLVLARLCIVAYRLSICRFMKVVLCE